MHLTGRYLMTDKFSKIIQRCPAVSVLRDISLLYDSLRRSVFLPANAVQPYGLRSSITV